MDSIVERQHLPRDWLQRRQAMAKGEQRGNREAKKPKKEKPKTIAAAASQKGTIGSSIGSKK
jgi:hypothetical protein